MSKKTSSSSNQSRSSSGQFIKEIRSKTQKVYSSDQKILIVMEGIRAEIVSPGFTAVYPEHINELLYGKPDKFMQETFSYFDSQSGWMRSATFSIIKTDKLESIARFIKGNCDFTKETDMTGMQYFDRNNYLLFADFLDYYSRLLQTEGQKQQLQQLVNDAVVWKAATPYFMPGYNGFAIDRHSGMTTYIMQKMYPLLNRSYTALDWYKAIRTE